MKLANKLNVRADLFILDPEHLRANPQLPVLADIHVGCCFRAKTAVVVL